MNNIFPFSRRSHIYGNRPHKVNVAPKQSAWAKRHVSAADYGSDFSDGDSNGFACFSPPKRHRNMEMEFEKEFETKINTDENEDIEAFSPRKG